MAMHALAKLLRTISAHTRPAELRKATRRLYLRAPYFAKLALFHLDAHADGGAGQRFAYLPWIGAHGDALIKLIDPQGSLLCPLPIFRRPDRLAQRQRIAAFVMEDPAGYRQILLQVLRPLRGQIAGVVFTLDWTPPMRQAVYVCAELGIPSVLVPHESVFARRDKYYVDRLTGVDLPRCDLTLCWGDLQREIFVERGYDPARIRVVGSPKLDAALSYEASLSRDDFCARYALDPALPVVVYAMQPLDSQYEPDVARSAQAAAIQDLVRACAVQRAQLIVRFPPSGHDLLPEHVMRELTHAAHVALDVGRPPRSSAHETLFHCRAVFSINSTMLIEGALMGRAAISTPYLALAQLWGSAGLRAAANARELAEALALALGERSELAKSGRAWAARAFSVGTFDGGSAQRIREQLTTLRSEGRVPIVRSGPCDHLFGDRFRSSADTAAFYREPTSAMAHLEAMLGFKRMLYSPGPGTAQTADVFVVWGRAGSHTKQRMMRHAERLERARLFVEDGFLRSVDIGLSGVPGLSLCCDSKAPYFDATVPSRLEDRLNSAFSLDAVQLARAERCMRAIRERRLSKYNHAPDPRSTFGTGPRVLVVDQRLGDDSVRFGLADEQSFERMLRDAFSQRPGHTILVKQHPDAISGKKSGFLSDERVAKHARGQRVVLLSENVNPHTLFDQVDEVFVVTSGMGMEALIAGLPVRCYGAPFYAGWGVTQDAIAVPRRRRRRSVTEIFHLAYIECGRYFDPRREAPAEIEDVIDYLATRKSAR